MNEAASWATLLALAVVIGVSAWLGALAQRAVHRGSFLRGYFLGNRSLGVWTMALTATVQSGGTFMGFPSLVYSYGWIVSLWIGAYMLVPLTGFAVLGKRLAQLSRRTGAITVPDLFRGRFDSPAVGLVSSLLIMFCMASMMVAQFKAGAILMKLAWPYGESLSLSETAEVGIDVPYLVGLAIFAVTVVGYTMFGGFLASVWTDLFQSVLMVIGVMILVTLAVPAAGGLEEATRRAVDATGPGFALGPGYSADGREYLTLGLAVSFFIVWIFGGIASPASVVRVMAGKNTAVLRKSIFVLSTYNLFIYPPLIMICVAARSIMPNLPSSDEVIPRMALLMTKDLFGGPLLAGIILAAPFGAVMATVSSYLVVIASGAVRDIYQRFVNPAANEMVIRRITYLTMIVVGGIAVALNIRPPEFLQSIVVFCTSCGAAAFLTPAVMACFWRRATAAGALAAMLSGMLVVLALFVVGSNTADPMIGPLTRFRPYFLFGLEPVVWGIAVSSVFGLAVSLATRPPSEEVVERMFGVESNGD